MFNLINDVIVNLLNMKWIFGAIFLIGYNFGDVTCFTSEEGIENQENIKLNCDVICSTISGELEAKTKEEMCQCSLILKNETTVNGFPERFVKHVEAHPNTNDTNKFSSTIVQKKVKRDTLTDFMAKMKSRTKLWTTVKPKKNINPIKIPTNTKMRTVAKKTMQLKKHPATYEELKDQLKNLKSRMSLKPLIKTRANFKVEEKSNLIDQLKNSQDKLRTKFKNINSKPAIEIKSAKKNVDTLNRLQNRFNIGGSKLGSINKNSHSEDKENDNNKGDDEHTKKDILQRNKMSSTTEIPNISHIPVIVLYSSTTTSVPEPVSIPRSSDIDNMPAIIDETKKTNDGSSSAIQRIKEKRNEVVTKIKDQLSMSKIKSTDKGVKEKKEES